ncbi:MAG: P-type conjugative transfer protein TrbL [Acidihalobacter sp.]|uniref:P-type conjugative transfer protein TrbL n=1 Tax=Acidihalobacter sp. TaxID=1872108 RepID=UPI00307DA198
MKSRHAFVAAALALAPAMANAAPMGLDAIQQTFQSATANWLGNSLHLGVGTFGALATIEYVWWAANRTLKGGEVGDLAAGAFLKFLSLGFFALLMMYAPTWIPDVLNGFATAAIKIGGGSGVFQAGQLDLNHIFMTGISLAESLYVAFGNSHLAPVSFGIPNMTWVMASITVLVAAVMCVVAFAMIAAQVLITLIEAYVAVGGGALMLAFNGSRWTQPFAEKYIGYVFSVGVKIFVLFLIVGLALHVGNTWIPEIQSMGSSWNSGSTLNLANGGQTTLGPMVFIEIGVEALLLGTVAWMVPGLAGSLMNGAPSMSLGSVGAAAGALGAAGAGVAAAGAAKAMTTADSTIGAAKFGGSLGNLARGSGIGAAATAGLSALSGAASDAFRGRGGAMASQIAGGLGDRAVSGFGVGTTGGGLANRVRAFGGGAGTGAGASLRNGIEGAGVGVSDKGARDGFGGGSGASGPTGARFSSPLADKAAELEKGRNPLGDHNRMPHQGHAGGITIRFGHQTD